MTNAPSTIASPAAQAKDFVDLLLNEGFRQEVSFELVLFCVPYVGVVVETCVVTVEFGVPLVSLFLFQKQSSSNLCFLFGKTVDVGGVHDSGDLETSSVEWCNLPVGPT